jgi:hypothetical protein
MEENASKFRESGTLIIEQIYNSEFQRVNKKTSEEKNVAESKFQDKVNLKAEKIRQKIASAEKLMIRYFCGRKMAEIPPNGRMNFREKKRNTREDEM